MEQPNSYLKWKIRITALVCLLLSNAVYAEIYTFEDKNGKMHFSDRQLTKQDSVVTLKQPTIISESDITITTSNSPDTKKRKYFTSNSTQVPKNTAMQEKYHPMIVQAASKYQLEPSFIHAVIAAESSYQFYAISPAGAQGLMQLMPATADRFGVNDPFDPEQSIQGGTKYLYKLLQEFKTKELALAAYNAGEGAVRRYNQQIPPYPETVEYVDRVMRYYNYYRNNL
ncbi:MAG: lytic transglycosylase domain-containing protein [Psychromonas sp.]